MAARSGRCCVAHCCKTSGWRQALRQADLGRRRRQRTAGSRCNSVLIRAIATRSMRASSARRICSSPTSRSAISRSCCETLFDSYLIRAISRKSPDQGRRTGVDLELAVGHVIVVEGHLGGLGQHQPPLGDVAIGHVGLGLGGLAAELPLARPGDLLRTHHHPAAAVHGAHPGRPDHEAEHRVFQGDHLRIALGSRLPGRDHRLPATGCGPGRR